MDIRRCSLMTFTLDIDVSMKKLSVEDILMLAKNAGVSYVDVQRLSPKALQAYLHASEATGVKPYCYIGILSFFSGNEEAVCKELHQQIGIAKALGAKLFMIVPFNIVLDKKVCAKLGREQVRQRLKKYFTMAVEMAKGTGIQVCFETTPQDYTCLSGIDDCRWILQQVPGLGLVYDTANMLPHGDDPLEYYEQLKEYVVHTHVKDVALFKPSWKDRLFPSEQTKGGDSMKCCLFGQGVIPLPQILQRMERDGYQGFYALEYSHPDKYPSSFAQHTQQMQRHMAFLEQN